MNAPMTSDVKPDWRNYRPIIGFHTNVPDIRKATAGRYAVHYRSGAREDPGA